jgi:hypothetical protein
VANRDPLTIGLGYHRRAAPCHGEFDMSVTLRRAVAAVAIGCLLLVTAACVPQSDLPSDCDASEVNRPATLTDAGLDPDAIDVCTGQQVTIAIDVERAGELHLHGYDDQVPEQEVAVGDQVELTFSATRAGQFPLELHEGGDETEIAILTVHEH